MSRLSDHSTAGSSQLMHWRSVRPEMVTTGTIRFPHFGQRVVRSMRFSRFFTPNSELKLLFHSSEAAKQEDSVEAALVMPRSPDLLCWRRPRQVCCTSLTRAEWLCRTADRIDPPRVPGSYGRFCETHLRRVLQSCARYYNNIR